MLIFNTNCLIFGNKLLVGFWGKDLLNQALDQWTIVIELQMRGKFRLRKNISWTYYCTSEDPPSSWCPRDPQVVTRLSDSKRCEILHFFKRSKNEEVGPEWPSG
ncbi:hypothetical protein CEXT_163291 [Caerostris extrusa]|uniref:Uncharacterized protein n=1 Tax=Caerostris extrusa TaxID=172846 RepID=A0AAV4SZQ8_CAEEX|nr:hypothetical protein CEXT_163291 [Caerostris extrusa]